MRSPQRAKVQIQRLPSKQFDRPRVGCAKPVDTTHVSQLQLRNPAVSTNHGNATNQSNWLPARQMAMPLRQI
jgi:hypothetical protein